MFSIRFPRSWPRPMRLSRPGSLPWPGNWRWPTGNCVASIGKKRPCPSAFPCCWTPCPPGWWSSTPRGRWRRLIRWLGTCLAPMPWASPGPPWRKTAWPPVNLPMSGCSGGGASALRKAPWIRWGGGFWWFTILPMPMTWRPGWSAISAWPPWGKWPLPWPTSYALPWLPPCCIAAIWGRRNWRQKPAAALRKRPPTSCAVWNVWFRTCCCSPEGKA